MSGFHRSMWLGLAALLAVVVTGPTGTQAQNPCNPCAANPCAANPCGGNPCAANPCNPCGGNPCAANPCNPCGGNPCAANPCNPCGASSDASRFKQPKGAKIAASTPALVELGAQLWEDKSLSSSGAMACSTCHVGSYGQMNASFGQAYPHRVAMPYQAAGVDEVNAAEMVQFCMVTPMANEPLGWGSEQLAALTAFVESLQTGFSAPAANPCGGNPCNPCGGNPCNPCGANPCNPCGANPCNPCGAGTH